MRPTTSWLAAVLGLTAGVGLGWWLAAGPRSLAASGKTENDKLPRFTEEREAAALHFVKKNLPEMLPVLAELKKSSSTQYQREIREIFHDTELLTELSDDNQRYELELKIWKAENKAHLLVAKLSTPSAAERKKIQEQIHDLAGDLVNLDLKILELKAEQLDRELGEVKDEMAKMTDNKEKITQERYQGLLDKAKKGKK
jgi:hypothetical protein